MNKALPVGLMGGRRDFAIGPTPGRFANRLNRGRWLLLGRGIPVCCLFALASVSGYGECRRRNDELGGRNDDMRFADYRTGLGGLIVSTNCLSA